MFPPVIRHPDNVTIAGKVLSYHVEHSGVVATDRLVTVDEKAWRHCAICEDHKLISAMRILSVSVTTSLTIAHFRQVRNRRSDRAFWQ